MNFFISDTFSDSLSRLPAQHQKAVKTTAFDLQLNPAQPGLKLHRLDRARDKNFWSVRAGGDIRIIVHRTRSAFVLCYADHHDNAYAWAERRRLERHPTTGAAQLVEVQETIREIAVTHHVVQERSSMRSIQPLRNLSDEQMLSWGVPTDWLDTIRTADEEQLLAIAERLPAEAAEAVLEVATGGVPRPVVSVSETSDPFDHPEAQRRFRVVADMEALQQALAYPWEKWMVFLHPEQRSVVEYQWSGPARVSGSAGTGKTVVALHRTAFLARRREESRVLLTTFSQTLAEFLKIRLRRLVGSEPRIAERIEVTAVDQIAARLWKGRGSGEKITTEQSVNEMLQSLYEKSDSPPFEFAFALVEWTHIVDLHNLTTWEAYRDIPRLGRKTRLPESRRQQLWSMYTGLREMLAEHGLVTMSQVYHALGRQYASEAQSRPYDHVVADEAQDISPAQLVFLSGLAGSGADALFFAGDTGQRIFRQPFSWVRLGVEVRGRSRLLRVNYRTSHQIRQYADRLLDPVVTDPDGNSARRDDTVSVFNGPVPRVQIARSVEEEVSLVAEWITELLSLGIAPESIGLIVRSGNEIGRAEQAATACGLPFSAVGYRKGPQHGSLAVATMHLSKGLEFRAVAVMACDDEVIPSQPRIEAVGDEADLDEVYTTERHLLYVACTRARDHLLVTGVEPGSEFLDDMQEWWT